MADPRPVSEDVFHQGYDDVTVRAQSKAPVFVVLPDRLFVEREGRSYELPFTPPSFHAIKAAAHLPVAAFLAVYRLLDGASERALDPRTRHVLDALRSSAAVAVRPESADDAALADMKAMADATRAYLDRALAGAPASRAALGAFAAQAGPLLLRLTMHATRVQLAALHEAVEHALEPLTATERKGLQVVVTGDHQARVRSLAMQYFQKRFAEAPAADDHVVYAEGAASAEEALTLVGKLRVDRAMARSFFRDGARLQRDVLGDAAAAILASASFETIAVGEAGRGPAPE